MAFFPHFVQNDFAPMFRLMDDYANHVASRSEPLSQSLKQSFRSFQPRFDFKETKDAYELHGELPGVEQKDINIEFTDANTISIRGRTETVREEGTRPTAAIEGGSEQKKLTDSEKKDGSYHKPTVEEDSAYPEGANNGTEVAKTPETSQEVAQAKADAPKYWVSERSVGTFARSFSFPQRVDQEAVKASLKNGILSIVVPKAAPVSKKINIE